MRRVAAIDLGTNTTLMFVAEVGAANALVGLEDRATITRLGRGVDRTGRLDPVAVEETLQVLRQYRSCADNWCAEIVAVGTSALRDAENRDDFLLPAQSILGVAVEVVAGEREAGLTFGGALEGMAAEVDNLMVVDIGGGSTELVLGNGNVMGRRVSLNLGSVRLHERYGLSAPAGLTHIAALRAEVASALRRTGLEPPRRLVATAATATTLAAMHLGLRHYDRERIHGIQLTAKALSFQVDRLLCASLEERNQMAGLDPKRADVLPVGALILEEIVRWCGCDALVVSDGGVRYGLAREALEKFGR